MGRNSVSKIYTLLLLIAFGPVAQSATDAFQDANGFIEKMYQTSFSDKAAMESLYAELLKKPVLLEVVLAVRSMAMLDYATKEVLWQAAMSKLDSANPIEQRNALVIGSHIIESEKKFKNPQNPPFFFDAKALERASELLLTSQDPILKKTYAQIAISKTKDGLRPAFKASFDSLKKDARLLLETIGTQTEVVFEFNEAQKAELEKIKTRLSQKEVDEFQDVFSVGETLHAQKWLDLALQKKDPSALSYIRNFSYEKLSENLNPAIEKSLVELLRSEDPALHNTQFDVLLNIGMLSEPVIKRYKEVFKKVIKNSSLKHDPMLLTSTSLGFLMGAEDVDFIVKLLQGTPDEQVQAIKMLDSLSYSSEESGEEKATQNPFKVAFEKHALLLENTVEALKKRELGALVTDELWNVELNFLPKNDKRWRKHFLRFYENSSGYVERGGAAYVNGYFFKTKEAVEAFKKLWEDRGALSHQEKLALLLLVGAVGPTSLSDKREEQQVVADWFIAELEKASIRDQEKVLEYLDLDYFGSFNTVADWVKKCQSSHPLASTCSLILGKSRNRGTSESLANFKEAAMFYFGTNSVYMPADLKLVQQAIHVFKTAPKGTEEHALASLLLSREQALLQYHPEASSMAPEKLIDFVAPLIRHKSIGLRTVALEEIEKSPNPDRYLVNEEAEKNIDLCKFYCDGLLKLVEEVDASVKTPFNESRGVFSNAVFTLKALSILKGASHCTHEKILGFREKIKNTFQSLAQSNPERAVGTSALDLFHNTLLDYLQKKPDETFSSSTFHFETFLLGLAQELNKTKPSSEVKGLLQQVHDQATQNMKQPVMLSSSGSGQTLYAYAASLSFWNPSKREDKVKVLEHVDEIVESAPNPQMLPYSPISLKYGDVRDIDSRVSNRSSERASVARALTLHTALYTNDQRPGKRPQHKANLIESLENYFSKYFDSLAAHLQRDSTHMGNDGIAPYYLYPSLFYSSYAFNALEADKTLTKLEREKVLRLKTLAEKKIKTLMNENGKFKLTASDTGQDKSDYRGFYGSDQALGLMSLETHVSCKSLPKVKGSHPGSH